MSLTAGMRLGPYEILSVIGAGGMGEVYRARDPRLGRDVAIKVLPAALTADPERLQRFEQEARAAAALNHPNILAVHDIGTHAGSPYIVSELLEGETLRERLTPGPLPVRKVVEYAMQIAHGLAAAHERGIVHRDLKPENIFVTSDARVKILDFGLAKLTQAEPALAGASTLPTTPPQTQAGLVLGTIGYMAPEQVRGLAADHRSDIFAFGAVLYEMLSGQRAFHGATTADTMTAILKEDPPDLPAAERHIPPALSRIVDRCLEKSPAARFQSAGDLAFALEGLSAHSDAVSAVQAGAVMSARGGRTTLARATLIATVGVLVGALAAGLGVWSLTRPTPPRVTKFTITPPPGEPFTASPTGANLAISPDGAVLVYQVQRGQTIQLYMRGIDELEAKPIPGTEGALNPFFSPDGKQIGFVADRKIKKVALAGGSASSVSDLPSVNVAAATWGTDDTVVFHQTGTGGGLFRVPASGGKPEKIASPDPEKGETDYRWPEILPDGKAVLFTIVPQAGNSISQMRIAVRSLETGEQRILVEGGSHPHYVPTGHLLYAQAGTLMAVPFDAARLQIAGAPVPVQEGIVTKAGGAADFAVAANGSLLYVPSSGVSGVFGELLRLRFIWLGRDGKPLGAAVAERLESPRNPRISPNGRRLAATVGPSQDGHIWIYDLTGAAQPLKLTFKDHNTVPTWTPDGTRLAFGSRARLTGGATPQNLMSIPADASSLEPERLVADEGSRSTGPAYSPDGRWLVFAGAVTGGTDNSEDLWVVSMDGDRKPRPWLQTRFAEAEASFSPDSRWIAYVSDQTGQPEVWVRPFPGPGAPIRVSSDGGHDPIWSRDGKELFYQSGTRLIAAEIVSKTPEVRFSAPKLLFDGGFSPTSYPGTPRSYDVAADGRFLMIEPTTDATSTSFVVVLNWFEELKRRAPTK